MVMFVYILFVVCEGGFMGVGLVFFGVGSGFLEFDLEGVGLR